MKKYVLKLFLNDYRIYNFAQGCNILHILIIMQTNNPNVKTPNQSGWKKSGQFVTVPVNSKEAGCNCSKGKFIFGIAHTDKCIFTFTECAAEALPPAWVLSVVGRCSNGRVGGKWQNNAFASVIIFFFNSRQLGFLNDLWMYQICFFCVNSYSCICFTLFIYWSTVLC